MQIKELKMLHRAGALSDARIAAFMGEWTVEMQQKGGERVTVEAQRGGVRQFKTLDAAWKALAAIGFERATIEERHQTR